jgi:hypothetical protein
LDKYKEVRRLANIGFNAVRGSEECTNRETGFYKLACLLRRSNVLEIMFNPLKTKRNCVI